MEAGSPPLVDITWALVQTLPVNKRIHEDLESMGGRCGCDTIVRAVREHTIHGDGLTADFVAVA